MLANELGNPSMNMNGEFIFDKRFRRDFHNGLKESLTGLSVTSFDIL